MNTTTERQNVHSSFTIERTYDALGKSVAR